jgi:hypothetical protein
MTTKLNQKSTTVVTSFSQTKFSTKDALSRDPLEFFFREGSRGCVLSFCRQHACLERFTFDRLISDPGLDERGVWWCFGGHPFARTPAQNCFGGNKDKRNPNEKEGDEV